MLHQGESTSHVVFTQAAYMMHNRNVSEWNLKEKRNFMNSSSVRDDNKMSASLMELVTCYFQEAG